MKENPPGGGSTGAGADAEWRLNFLAEASRLLADSADERAALVQFADLVVPALADWCSVHVSEPDGTITRVAVVHADPGKRPYVERLMQEPGIDPSASVGIAHVLATGEAELFEEIDQSLLEQLAIADAQAALYQELGYASAAILPLAGRRRVLGVVGLVYGSSGRRYSNDDMLFFRELAARCASVIDAADVHREAVRQQTAVAELGQRALAGLGLAPLLDTAARLVAETLRVELVEILERQPAGRELRLVAGRGWDEGRVGNATVPAGPRSHGGYTLHSNSVVVMDDLATETRFRPSALLVDHGVVSGLAVAIEGPGDDYGVLGVHTRYRRTFTDDDALFLRSIAAVIGAAVQRRRAEDELRASRNRLEFSLESSGTGVWEWDLRTDALRWSASLERLYGLAPGTFGGTFDDYVALIHPDDRDAALARIRATAAEGREHHIEHRFLHTDGDVRWIEGRGRVVHDDDGTPIGMMGVALDVTARKLAEQTAAEAHDRMAFLEQASAILNADLAVDRSIADLTRLVVPRLADWCTVELLDRGRLHQVASFYADPQKAELARELRRRYQPEAGAPGPASVARTGKAQMVSEIPDALLASSAHDEEHLRLIRQLGPHSAMIVPLVARGRTLGVMTLTMADSGRRFDESDLAFAESLAGRAATAIDNARLFEEWANVARTLQRTLLPPETPRIPGMEVAARYQAAGEGIEIGGDFYDAFETGDGAWAVVIGDVCGKGTDAAALTGLVRHTVRAAATRHRAPGSVLGVVNEALSAQIDDARFCTVAYLRIEPVVAGRVQLVCGAAGHPAPLVVRADGKVEVLDCRGWILGAFADVELVEASCELTPGDAVVLFTDGVLEARDPETGETFGDDRLADALAAVAGAGADQLADAVVAAVTDFDTGDGRDDVALIVIRLPPQPA